MSEQGPKIVTIMAKEYDDLQATILRLEGEAHAEEEVRRYWQDRANLAEAALGEAERENERLRRALEKIRDEVPKMDRGSLALVNEAIYIASFALSTAPDQEGK